MKDFDHTQDEVIDLGKASVETRRRLSLAGARVLPGPRPFAAILLT